MSYLSLLKHKCQILSIVETQTDGITSNAWQVVAGGSSVRCFLDLNFIRAGKDPIWNPEQANTAQNRAGVLFLPPGVSLAQPGNRIKMLVGPAGTFEVMSSLDEAWTPRRKHHMECYVREIDRVLAGS